MTGFKEIKAIQKELENKGIITYLEPCLNGIFGGYNLYLANGMLLHIKKVA